ncbi:DUF4397 domain-containing protein [Mucilaginibacter sp.]|uniref:DUF4397 domain-containing protein n=1 Tax=Mucilaginibacter sp. TaxID=1882438 RepID=UPI00260385BE|nr:DUF4397 domain-containing protein [Mucilaginibacter sp.]MDB4923110.1 hypothetical protein [Mucilaginibacter sp.]
MKNFKTISKNLVVRISAVCILSVMLSSCLKNHSSDTPAPPVALLTVIQASPGQPPLNFLINGERVNVNALNFGSSIDYFRAYTGKRTFAFTNNGAGSTVVSDTATLKQNVAYSLCLVNKVSTPQLLLLTDSISQPTSGNASLRFVNLSPDAPAVDLAVKDGAVLVANKTFKGFSSFKPLVGKSYTLEIRKTGTATVLTTLPNVSLNNGFVYTVYFRGLAAATDATKLTADLIINAHPSYN